MGIRPHKKQQYLESPEMCLRRIEDRVRSGGHNIPEDTVRRRYQRSLAMFARTYSNLIPNWYLFLLQRPLAPRRLSQRSTNRSQRMSHQISIYYYFRNCIRATDISRFTKKLAPC